MASTVSARGVRDGDSGGVEMIELIAIRKENRLRLWLAIGIALC